MSQKRGKRSQGRDKSHDELIYGPHALIECCRAGRRKVRAVYTTKPVPKAWRRVQDHLAKHIPLQYVTKDVLTRMAGTDDHGGVVAYVTPFKFAPFVFDPKKKPKIVILDAIQDVRNVGAILRSVYCLGIDGVVICKRKGAPLSAVVFKTSAGLAEHLDIYQAPTMKAAVTELKKAGYALYMAVIDGGADARKVSFSQPWGMVIGNEAHGITKEIQKEGSLVSLPQKRSDISFNASVAAGILLFVASQS